MNNEPIQRRKLYQEVEQRLLDTASSATASAARGAEIAFVDLGAPDAAQLLADLRAQQAMRRRVLGSALYPAVVVSVGVLVIGFLLAYVVPRFAEMVLGSGVQVSPASRMLLTLSAAMHQSQGLTLAILLALAAALVNLPIREARPVWPPVRAPAARGAAARALVSSM